MFRDVREISNKRDVAVQVGLLNADRGVDESRSLCGRITLQEAEGLVDLVARTRRNHALEHATVELLLEDGLRPPIGGYSMPSGFFIFGRVGTEQLSQKANEALRLLKEGEAQLAISPYCGTNLATSALLAGFLMSVILGPKRRRNYRRLPLAIAVGLGAAIVGRPIGMALQRYTTLAAADMLEITGVLRLGSVGEFSLHKVSAHS